MQSLSWKPIRRGLVYCSPGCGHGCTYASFLQATKKADSLAARLGKGWSPRVWENLGWHYEVIAADGRLRVHPGSNFFQPDYYTAFLNTETGGGCLFGAPSAKTPEAAVRKVVEIALGEAKDLFGLLLDLRDLAGAQEALTPRKVKALIAKV